jgi:hypothetical protein
VLLRVWAWLTADGHAAASRSSSRSECPNADPRHQRPCGWPGCEEPVRLGRLACPAHLDEMNIVAQLSRDRRCPDCGELSPIAVLLHWCGSQEEGRD